MSKRLVAYFSASGVTARVAHTLASAAGADLHEIVPASRYTDADLDWTNKRSRSSVEMSDASSRPEISGSVKDIDAYDTIFVGFPIWWYREPSIIDTFLEQYDFSGKTIVLFATSGGSGFGNTAKGIRKMVLGAKVVEGKVFNSRVSEDRLASWLKGLKL